MPKLKEVRDTSGEFHAFKFFCPACRTDHVLRDLKFNGDHRKPSFTPSVCVRTWDENYLVLSICHSYVIDGRIHYLYDCSHEMAGKVVELPDLDVEG